MAPLNTPLLRSGATDSPKFLPLAT